MTLPGVEMHQGSPSLPTRVWHVARHVLVSLPSAQRRAAVSLGGLLASLGLVLLALASTSAGASVAAAFAGFVASSFERGWSAGSPIVAPTVVGLLTFAAVAYQARKTAEASEQTTALERSRSLRAARRDLPRFVSKSYSYHTAEGNWRGRFGVAIIGGEAIAATLRVEIEGVGLVVDQISERMLPGESERSPALRTPPPHSWLGAHPDVDLNDLDAISSLHLEVTCIDAGGVTWRSDLVLPLGGTVQHTDDLEPHTPLPPWEPVAEEDRLFYGLRSLSP